MNNEMMRGEIRWCLEENSAGLGGKTDRQSLSGKTGRQQRSSFSLHQNGI